MIREVLGGPVYYCSLLSKWRLGRGAVSQTLISKPYQLYEFDRIDTSCIASFRRRGESAMRSLACVSSERRLGSVG